MAADTPPSLADEHKSRHPGRWQGLVLGLLAAAGLAAAVAGAAVFFGGAGEDGDDGEAPRQTSLNRGWKGPPADAREAELIPQALGRWDLTAADANPGNAMLGVDLEGFHGAYGTVRTADTVDLAVYRADAATAETMIAAVRAKTDDPERFRGVTLAEPNLPGAGRTLRFDVPEGDGVPELHGLLAAADGWLLFARSATEDELLPFVAEYMRTVESDGEAEAPTDAPAQGYRGLPDPPPGGGLGGAAATD